MPNDPPRSPPRLPLAPKRPKTEIDAMLEGFLETHPLEEQRRDEADRRRDKLWAEMIANVMERFAKVEDEAGRASARHLANHNIAMMAIKGLQGDMDGVRLDVNYLKTRPYFGQPAQAPAAARASAVSHPSFQAMESLGVMHDTGSFELHDGTIIQRDTVLAWKQQSSLEAQKIADKAILDRETAVAAEKWRSQQKNREKVLWGVIALVVAAIVTTMGVVFIKQAARDIERGAGPGTVPAATHAP